MARIAATFKLIVLDGCDTYSRITQQKTVERKIYEVGDEAQQITVEGLYGVDP